MKIYLHNSKKVVILHPIYTEYSCMSFKKVLFEEKQFWAVINLYQGSALL